MILNAKQSLQYLTTSGNVRALGLPVLHLLQCNSNSTSILRLLFLAVRQRRRPADKTMTVSCNQYQANDKICSQAVPRAVMAMRKSSILIISNMCVQAFLDISIQAFIHTRILRRRTMHCIVDEWSVEMLVDIQSSSTSHQAKFVHGS